MRIERASSVIPVERKDLNIVFLRQFFYPTVKSFTFGNFQNVIVVIREIRHTDNTDIFYVVSHTTAVGKNANIDTLNCLLDHIFVGTELSRRIYLNNQTPAGFRFDIFGQLFKSLHHNRRFIELCRQLKHVRFSGCTIGSPECKSCRKRNQKHGNQ